ncbi:MAG: hypothetical protein J2P38_04705 [Candidatus Dormibacteraeota bacterium]|nr:hypothetical protein [Candidatus Dormibacteraeota bacterium]
MREQGGERRTSVPAFWFRLPVPVGNAVQVAGVGAGAGLILAAGAIRGNVWAGALAMVGGFMLVYLSCHSIGHWLVGRTLGLRFRYIGVRGTDHPEAFPAGLRQLMSFLPMFTTVSTRESRAAAGGHAVALYMAAGQASTTVCTLLAAGLALRVGAPGAPALLAVAVLVNAYAAVMAAFNSRVDYAKAAASWHSAPPRSRSRRPRVS